MAEFRSFTQVHDGLGIRIAHDDDAVAELLNYLFEGANDADGARAAGTFRVEKTGDYWRLQTPDGRYFKQVAHPMDLALPLMNLLLLEFARENTLSVSLHAALVSGSAGAVLMPGAPGSGKTAASLWLTRQGWRYHTDELVSLRHDGGELSALTRAFTLRRRLLDLVRNHPEFVGLPDRAIRTTERNGWISHRAVNPEYRRDIPPLRAIVFPVYGENLESRMVPLSRAQAAMELMRSQFRGQTHPDHGFASITALVRRVPVFMLGYQRFEQISEAMAGLPS